MKAKEMMNQQVELIEHNQTVQMAAKKMADLNVGALPVRRGDRLVGMLTDRDIVIRGVAYGADLSRTLVSEIMSAPAVYVYENQDAQEVAHLMEVKKIRRMPVLNEAKRLVGIVTLTDFGANEEHESLTGEVVKVIAKEQPVSIPPHH